MKNKIFAILAIVVVIGIIIVCTLGFNVDFDYKGYHLIDINIGKDFNIKDIKSITNEVFNNTNVEIQKAGVFSDNVTIKVNEATEEQKQLLNTKINEKYGLENTYEDINDNYIPRYRLRDIIKPYAIPLSISTVIILIYMAIKFRKLGASKVIYQAVSYTIMGELLYGSIIAITRCPINRLVMSVAIIIYISIMTALTGIYEKQMNKRKNKEEVKEEKN